MKRTLLHSSGHTARSSAAVICSSCCPLSTPRQRTVLWDGGGVRWGAGGRFLGGGKNGGGGQGATHSGAKPLSFSHAVTSAGEDPMCSEGGLPWGGGV